MEQIMVSVSCRAYNHENYIEQCLKGLVMQKTSFKYEIIVHDDASTDGTADIIRKYAEKYPDIIVPILQTENQYSQGVNTFKTYIDPIIRGKYIALCEGDDFWTDENKLQKQFDAMENNPECSMCVHSTACVDRDGNPIDRVFPPVNISSGVLSSQQIIDLLPQWLFQLTSYFCRVDDYRKAQCEFELSHLFPVGDMKIIYFMASLGDYYYLKDTMSCYRVNAKNSWTSRQTTDSKIKFAHRMCNMEYAYINYLKEKRPDLNVGNIRDNVIPYYEFQYSLYEENYRKILLNPKLRKQLRNIGYKHRIKAIILGCIPAKLVRGKK